MYATRKKTQLRKWTMTWISPNVQEEDTEGKSMKPFFHSGINVNTRQSQSRPSPLNPLVPLAPCQQTVNTLKWIQANFPLKVKLLTVVFSNDLNLISVAISNPSTSVSRASSIGGYTCHSAEVKVAICEAIEDFLASRHDAKWGRSRDGWWGGAYMFGRVLFPPGIL